MVSANVEGKVGVVKMRVGGLSVFELLNLSDGGLVVGSDIIGGQVEVPVAN